MDEYDEFRSHIIKKYIKLIEKKRDTVIIKMCKFISDNNNIKNYDDILREGYEAPFEFINEAYEMGKQYEHNYGESLIVALFFPEMNPRDGHLPEELSNRKVRDGLIKDIDNALYLLNDNNMILDDHIGIYHNKDEYDKAKEKYEAEKGELVNIINYFEELINGNINKYLPEYHDTQSFGNYFGKGPIKYGDPPEPVIYMNDNCELFEHSDYSPDSMVTDLNLDGYILGKFPDQKKPRHRRSGAVFVDDPQQMQALATMASTVNTPLTLQDNYNASVASFNAALHSAENSPPVDDNKAGATPSAFFGRKLYRGKRGGVYYKKKGRKVYVR